MYSLQSIVNNEFAVDIDGSVNQILPEVKLGSPNDSICFQFKWDATIDGKFIFDASVYDDTPIWIPLVACEAVEFETIQYSTYRSNIIAIPDIWKLVSIIRIRYEANSSSSGNFSCAIRVVPV